MLPKSTCFYVAFLLLGTAETVLGRYQWLERKGLPVYLYPRRFGNEQDPSIQKLQVACPGEVCGVLAGQAVTPLLAAQPECSQQDHADAIIDASRQFDAATQQNMIEIAIEYRQAEKNTPPDFTQDPPSKRNSVFCQKAPKNAELNGLVQKQDPENDPDLFFDPALKATVRKGTQANTEPFGGVAAAPAPAETAVPVETRASEAATVTVTVSGTATAAASTSAPTIVVGTPDASGADFGSCTAPQIEFGRGFDNRQETSFQPVDKASFSQGSAQNINIITRAICDTLVNTCGANQAALDLCAVAQAEAAAATPEKTGIQADVFNQVFGITTQFADVQAFDDQGRPIEGTGSAGDAATSAEVPAATTTAAATASEEASTPAPTVSTGGAGIGDFGTCTVPEIIFAAGLDGRRETAFAPADLDSFSHGSAQNINIITQSICDTLTNSCGADNTAKATCAEASAAATTVAAGTGGQADAFNARFGITTNFAAVAQVDNQGRVVGDVNLAPSVPANDDSNDSNDEDGTAATPAPASGDNLQTFSGKLGGVAAPVVTALGDGRFQVEGNAAFNNLRSAQVRSCDVQNNQCANAANASGNRDGLNVAACNAQQATCIQNAGN